MLTFINKIMRLRNAGGHLVNIKMSMFELLEFEKESHEDANIRAKAKRLAEDIEMGVKIGVNEADVVDIIREVTEEYGPMTDAVRNLLDQMMESIFRKSKGHA